MLADKQCNHSRNMTSDECYYWRLAHTNLRMLLPVYKTKIYVTPKCNASSFLSEITLKYVESTSDHSREITQFKTFTFCPKCQILTNKQTTSVQLSHLHALAEACKSCMCSLWILGRKIFHSEWQTRRFHQHHENIDLPVGWRSVVFCFVFSLPAYVSTGEGKREKRLSCALWPCLSVHSSSSENQGTSRYLNSSFTCRVHKQ